jgi:hypothetical protein
MHPTLSHRLNDLRVQDLRASATRDRRGTRARPTPVTARGSLVRHLTTALAAVAFVLGAR